MNCCLMVLLLMVGASHARAELIKSDCTTAELKILQSPEILNHFVLKGEMLTQDCTPVKVPPDKEYLLVATVINAQGGYQSYLSLFDRKGLNDKAVPFFKSAMMSFDMFPVQVNKVHRLIFVHPSSDKAKLVLFVNLQISPAATKLSRWEFSYETKELVETANRFWLLEAGVLPKIYDDTGVFRALLDSRAVEL